MIESQVANKFKILQDFYWEKNSIKISYSEAKGLYYRLSEEEREEFNKYYKDQTDYEIITVNSMKPQPDLILGCACTETETCDVCKTRASQIKADAVTKITLEGYAKSRGLCIDPQWAGYSYEEILEMEQNGVVIPQDVLDLAHSMQADNAAAIAEDGEQDVEDDTAEKEPFLKLIPKAVKKIRECSENSEKISDEIAELLPEKQRRESKLAKRMKNQKNTLEEYEANVKEWKSLKDKLDRGEQLTNSESNRFSKLTEVMQTKKDEDSSFSLDKNAIAASLSEINILAALGVDLAEKTIEIGETLGDYTSQSNFKNTLKTVTSSVGFFITGLITTIRGKRVGEDAVKIGNDTKEYSQQSKEEVGQIASTLGIEESISYVDENGEVVEGEAVVEEDENGKDKEKEGKYRTGFFKVTDAEVIKLIQEGRSINSVLKAIIKRAKRQSRQAKKDNMYASFADRKITKFVDRFKFAEERRKKEIAAKEADIREQEEIIRKKEQEINDEKAEIEDLTGYSSEEVDKYIINEEKDKRFGENGPQTDEATKAKIEEHKKNIENCQLAIADSEAKIEADNEAIEVIKMASELHRARVKADTQTEKNGLNRVIPAENDALKLNKEFQEEELPEHDEKMDYINQCGLNLIAIGSMTSDVGAAQVIYGHALMSSLVTLKEGIFFVVLGSINITKGVISMAIGASACIVSDDESFIEEADEQNVKAGERINTALDHLIAVDTKLTEVTKDEVNQKVDLSQEDSVEETEGAEGTEDAAENVEGSEDNDAGEGVDGAGDAGDAVNAGDNENGENVDAVQDAADENPTEEVPAEEAVPEEAPADGVPAEEAVPEEAPADGVPAEGASSDEESEETSKKSSDKENVDPYKAQDQVDDINNSAEADSKDSQKIEKDTKKDKKRLEKEAKKLQKTIKKDQKQIEKMTEESVAAAKKQEELAAEFEALTVESDALAAEQEAAQNSQPAQQSTQPAQGAANSMSIGGPASGGVDNTAQLAQNDQRMNLISTEFKIQGRIITRNSKKIKKLQKTTQTNNKKFVKKTKVLNKKVKEEEKNEQNKQKRLAKQLGAVGIAENVFSITTATGIFLNKIGTGMIVTGTGMLSNPATASAGAALISSGTPIQTTGITMETVGTYGTISCGVTKTAINIANGNLAAGLMSLGQTVISGAAAVAGLGEACNSTLKAVSAGLNVVQSSADLVNNVRAVQGKEASGFFSKVSAVAGAASAVASAASSFEKTKVIENGQVVVKESAFKSAGALGKAAQVGSIVGSALSSTSQVMTSFGNPNSKFAQTLGTVGGALSTVSAVASMADTKMQNNENKNNQRQNDTEANTAQQQAPKEMSQDEIKTAMDNKASNMQAEMNNQRTETSKDLMASQGEANKQMTTAGANGGTLDDRVERTLDTNMGAIKNDFSNNKDNIIANTENWNKPTAPAESKFGKTVEAVGKGLEAGSQIYALVQGGSSKGEEETAKKSKKTHISSYKWTKRMKDIRRKRLTALAHTANLSGGRKR